MNNNKCKIVILPGDGIGPEIMESTLSVLTHAGFEFEGEWHEIGLASIEQGKEAVPEEVVQKIHDYGLALKGPTTTPTASGHTSANVQLRRALELFANVRPIRSIPGIKSHYTQENIDLVIVRENTEGLYSGIEYQPHPDVAQAIKIITRNGCQRVAKYAFELAIQQNRKRVTAVHKANIMKLTDGMMLEEFYKQSLNYPSIKADEIIVDNCCMQLVTNPSQFDVLVTENLYGDIISDLSAGLIGGLGVAPSANIGEHCAIFEAVHGSAPTIAGKGIANPTALIMSSVLMLHHVGKGEIGEKIYQAIRNIYRDGKVLTGDMGGSASTKQFTDEIIRVMESNAYTAA